MILVRERNGPGDKVMLRRDLRSTRQVRKTDLKVRHVKEERDQHGMQQIPFCWKTDTGRKTVKGLDPGKGRSCTVCGIRKRRFHEVQTWSLQLSRSRRFRLQTCRLYVDSCVMISYDCFYQEQKMV